MKKKVAGVAVIIAMVISGVVVSQNVCLRVWWKTGLCLTRCPDGQLQQTVSVHALGLRRGALGSVSIGVTARYVTSDDSEHDKNVSKWSAKLALVDGAGTETPLPVKKWTSSYGNHIADVTLPDVPDGDYLLRTNVTSKIGSSVVDVKLPLYSPARIHVITDRPLYEPGNTVHFRALVLRARDLAPLDHRPGRFQVTDPDGEVLLEEKAPAGDWGVVAGSFPLDGEAQSGTWRVSWLSGDAEDHVEFTVQPFTLPRFRVDAVADKPFYRAGETPHVSGAVIYSSGAPVANATLDITWSVGGDWPPPPEWMATDPSPNALPQHTKSDANGAFTLALPKIPDDLTGQVTLGARIAATDAAGDHVEGGVALLLSHDAIQVSAVTELSDGLVAGFNNRVYLRVTSPDGRALENTKIIVRRTWDARDPGVPTVTDEDGVASLQLDPGPPINVVIPPPPYRPPPKAAVVSRNEPRDLLGGSASLADQVVMDRWLPALEPCAKWMTDGASMVGVALRVDTAGNLTTALGGGGPLDDCVLGVLRGKRLEAGQPRLYAVQFTFADPPLPQVAVTVDAARGEPKELADDLAQMARGARDCLPIGYSGDLPHVLAWQVHAGAKQVQFLGWISASGGSASTDATAAERCMEPRIASITLADVAGEDGIGIARFGVSAPTQSGENRPQATVILGYELSVSADVEGVPSASTTIRLTPGTVPPLRLRATPTLAAAGADVTVEALRGPDFGGELPEKLTLDWAHGQLEAKLDPNTHTAKFTLDAKTEGWCVINGAGVRALVFVKPRAALSVSVTPDKARYAPGDHARLAIATKQGDRAGPAAVGLFGVDESLAQLVTLAGPDDLARVRPKVETSQPAFGVLDGQALALGRIRGANAAAATVARVTEVPTDSQIDAVVNAEAESHFDTTEVLTDHFYLVLAELHTQTRQWEADAPKSEKMQPKTMARLWRQALAACEKRGEAVTDAYGRRLRLRYLPSDLLELTDPRNVVADGTRLPEDVENWAAWVDKEKP
jgi:hypothetical protein